MATPTVAEHDSCGAGRDTTPAALADRLEGLRDGLAELAEPVAEPDWLGRFGARLEDIRRLCSDLRTLALLYDAGRGCAPTRWDERLRAILLTLSESIRRLGSSSRGIAAKVGDQLHELDAIADLPVGEEVIGRLNRVVLGVQSAAQDMEKDLDTMAGGIARANERICTLERELIEARQRALYDGLTRVYSRATLDERLHAAVAAADTNGPWSFLLADIDHFKKINDLHGHLVGDAVLYRLAQSFEECLREHTHMGLTARYGGEEFGIILPSTDLSAAHRIAEHLRERIAAARWQCNRTPYHEEVLQATISIGVTEYCRGDTVATLVHRADQALYRAKQEGRNKVAVAT